MRKLRQSGVMRGIIVTILLVCVFGAAFCGWHGLWMVEFAYGDSWQDNWVYRTLLSHNQTDVQNAFVGEMALQEGGLTYVDEMSTEATVSQLRTELSAENTNYRYQILTSDGKTVVESNLLNGESLKTKVLDVSYTTFTVDATTYILASGVSVDPQISDRYADLFATYEKTDGMVSLVVVGASLALGALICLFYLLWTAGYRADVDGLGLSRWDKIPLELHLFLFGGGAAASVIGWIYIFREAWSAYWYNAASNSQDMFTLGIIAASCVAVVGVAMVCGVFCTLAARMRCRMVWRTTLCYGILHLIYCKVKMVVNNLPVLWRVGGCFLLYICLNFMARYGLSALYPVPVFLVDVGALALLLWWVLAFRRVRDGAEAIAAGNLSHRIDSEKLPHDLKTHAENLNNISLGMENAVDSRIKSERFKAELITNVSHDLKTPLTSIINYVDLLKGTEQTDPHAAEYIEVLDRKSQRLKKLTEDLVEASKASTGTLKVDREKIGVAQLLDQAIGEYQEKLESKGLFLVTTIPEGECYVLADGRHLWRVIDNLLSNCVKYAMEGTRVYVELIRGHGQVELSVKNITREPITTSPEQLVERFVRGDDARTSEGSGLGLSIAKSLTELQEGTFQLVIDGDLFKAIITLPQAG